MVPVNISGETLARTVPAHWVEGASLNLETALKLGDELGGHIVTGHVDGVGEVVAITPVGDRCASRLPRRTIWPLYRRQGLDHRRWRVADGERNRRSGRRHLPFRAEHHSPYRRRDHDWRAGRGDRVNLEIDVLARYLMRMQALKG
jgi:riboflavin synthase